MALFESGILVVKRFLRTKSMVLFYYFDDRKNHAMIVAQMDDEGAYDNFSSYVETGQQKRVVLTVSKEGIDYSTEVEYEKASDETLQKIIRNWNSSRMSANRWVSQVMQYVGLNKEEKERLSTALFNNTI